MGKKKVVEISEKWQDFHDYKLMFGKDVGNEGER